MPYPRLRPIATRIRGWRAPLLYRWALRRYSIPGHLTRSAALVVAPHPDDETFACGGFIAMKRAAGVKVSVVFVTDGSQSQQNAEALEPADLVATRKQEAVSACGILGMEPADLFFLDGADGKLQAMSGAQRREMTRHLAEIVERLSPGEICVPHHGDCHPDHEASYQLTMEAMELAGSGADVLEYPVWILWKLPMLRCSFAELGGAQRLDVSSVQEAKNRAIAEYRSQLPSMPRGFVPRFSLGEEFFWRRGKLSEAARSSRLEIQPLPKA